MQQIVPGVWFREGDIKKEGHCNNVIIEMKDYLVVVDANYPGGARLAMEDAKKLSPKPVKYVFITHHHGDHNYGAVVWTESGATTLSTPQCFTRRYYWWRSITNQTWRYYSCSSWSFIHG